MSKLEVPKTIVQQLGNQFFAMVGVKNLGGTENSLSFQIGKNPKGITHIKIELDRGTDTYNVMFYRFGKQLDSSTDPAVTKTLVYVDMLHDIIEHETGLYTKM